MSACFQKYEHITSKKDFQRVYAQGKRIVSTSFALYLLQYQQRPYRRIGITARKYLGHAVIRNRCKRLVRELFRKNKDAFPPESDVIVVITRDMVGKRYAAVVEEFFMIQPQLTDIPLFKEEA
jgi:ribonuclease P protein component